MKDYKPLADMLIKHTAEYIEKKLEVYVPENESSMPEVRRFAEDMITKLKDISQ